MREPESISEPMAAERAVPQERTAYEVRAVLVERTKLDERAVEDE